MNMKPETFIVFKTMNIDECSKRLPHVGLFGCLVVMQVHVILPFASFHFFSSFIPFFIIREYALVHAHAVVVVAKRCSLAASPSSPAVVPFNMVVFRTQLNVNS